MWIFLRLIFVGYINEKANNVAIRISRVSAKERKENPHNFLESPNLAHKQQCNHPSLFQLRFFPFEVAYTLIHV